MAFFSKITGGKKSSAAGDLFKSKNADKLGDAGASFKKRLDARIEKDLADYAKAKRMSGAARGEKDVPEMSENAKKMLTILAHQKVQKEIKKEQKAAVAAERAVKKEKQARELVKKNLQYQADLKAKELLEAQQNKGKSYFFGYTEE